MSHLIENNLIDSISENGKGTILRAIATFVAMEVCGSFLTGKTGPGSTAKNFKKFCNSKYMPEAYHEVSQLLYSIFRNGVAHSYVAQGGALLGGDPRTAGCHLQFYEQGLFIYIHKFAEDVTSAIRSLWVDIKNDSELTRRYYSVFEKLDEMGTTEYNRFLREHKIKPRPERFEGDIRVSIE